FLQLLLDYFFQCLYNKFLSSIQSLAQKNSVGSVVIDPPTGINELPSQIQYHLTYLIRNLIYCFHGGIFLQFLSFFLVLLAQQKIVKVKWQLFRLRWLEKPMESSPISNSHSNSL